MLSGCLHAWVFSTCSGTLAVMGRSVVGWKEGGNGEISGWKQRHKAMTLNPGERELSAGEVRPQ